MLTKLQKLANANPTSLCGADVLKCATSSGAAAIGLDGLGSIEVGAKADVILVDVSAAHLTPLYNQDFLVYSAAGNDVDSVIVNGRVIMHARHIVSFDVNEAVDRVRSLAVQTGTSR